MCVLRNKLDTTNRNKALLRNTSKGPKMKQIRVCKKPTTSRVQCKFRENERETYLEIARCRLRGRRQPDAVWEEGGGVELGFEIENENEMPSGRKEPDPFTSICLILFFYLKPEYFKLFYFYPFSSFKIYKLTPQTYRNNVTSRYGYCSIV